MSKITTLHNFVLKLHNETLIRVWNTGGDGPNYEGNVEDLLGKAERRELFFDRLLNEKVYFVYGSETEEGYMDIVTANCKCYLNTLLACDYNGLYSLKEGHNNV